MKTILTLPFLLLCSLLFSQEFEVYDNGLIYSPEAMKKLGEIVGDKNSAFRECDLSKTFKSIPQTRGVYFSINYPDRKQLNRELEENISLKDFINKYGGGKDYKLSLVTKLEYTNYEKKKVIEIKEQPRGGSLIIEPSKWGKSITGNWIFDFSGNNAVKLMYFENDFSSLEIPYSYARMVQYSECLVDTTSQIFIEKAKRTGVRYSNEGRSLNKRVFLKYLKKSFKKKEPEYDFDKDYDKDEYAEFSKKAIAWNDSFNMFIEDTLSKKERFKELLEKAYIEVKEEQNSDDEIEEYVAKYLSKDKALELKRGRIVVGGCSMDMSPRYHAMSIAQLSAESFNWDIFLRAHLNIMNDRFERVSDGSWAMDARETYIKELEELNIDVLGLILGISFRINNPSENHYYGSINRLGRSLSESENTKSVNEELIAIISDDELDDYNRMLIYYLYDNYNYYLDKSEAKDKYKKAVKDVIIKLPKYLISDIQ